MRTQHIPKIPSGFIHSPVPFGTARTWTWLLCAPFLLSCGISLEDELVDNSAVAEMRKYVVEGFDRVTVRDFEELVEHSQNSMGAFGGEDEYLESSDDRDPFRGERAAYYSARYIPRQAVVYAANLNEADLSQFKRFHFWAKAIEGSVTVTPGFTDIDGEIWAYHQGFPLTEDYQEFQVELDPSRFKLADVNRTTELKRNGRIDFHRTTSFYLVMTKAQDSGRVAVSFDDLLLSKELSDSTVAKTLARGVNHVGEREDFHVPFTHTPVVVAAMQTTIGTDPAGIRMSDLSKDGVNLVIEEENSTGRGTAHVREEVGYLALPAGGILDRHGRAIGEAGQIDAGHAGAGGKIWHRVKTKRSYRDPVVVMSINTLEGKQPAHVRLRNIGPSSFEFKIEEWNYLDGFHVEERLSYIVMEKGEHALSNTHGILAGTTQTGTAEGGQAQWEKAGFSKAFSSIPVVVSQVQTFAGPDAVVTRQRNITASSFETLLQEEKANDGLHASETIGYIAMGKFVERTWFPLRLDDLGEWDWAKDAWGRDGVVDLYHHIYDERVHDLQKNGFVTQMERTITLGKSRRDSQYWDADFPEKIKTQLGQEMVVVIEGEKDVAVEAYLKGEPHAGRPPEDYTATHLEIGFHDYKNPGNFTAFAMSSNNDEEVSLRPFSMTIHYRKRADVEVEGMKIRVRIMTRKILERNCPFCFVWDDVE